MEIKAEYKYQIEINQNTKGFSYFQIKVKGDSGPELEEDLDNAITLAKNKCTELNERFGVVDN